jgi:hypothetical protein
MVASAQHDDPPMITLGVFAGPSVPAGRTDVLYHRGYHVGGLAELRTPIPALGVRLDVGYRHFGMPRVTITDLSGIPTGEQLVASMGMLTGTANVVLRVPGLRSAVQPYAMGGAGLFRQRVRLTSTTTTYDGSSVRTLRGVDAGLGLEAALARVTLFTEARYERIGPGPLRFVPLSLGFRLH